MKRYCIVIFFILASTIAAAQDYIGGEMYYTYQGNGASATSHIYKVTLKLYRGNSMGSLPVTIPITVFRSITGISMKGPVYAKKYATLQGPFQIDYFSTTPCISPPQSVNYSYGLYSATFDLQESSYGYIVAYQRCCRQAGINNLEKPDEQGYSFFAKIPGVLSTTPPSVTNTSPRFLYNDSSVICPSSRFSIDFSAVDDDGDNLSYEFTAPYQGAGNFKDGINCNMYRPDPACFPIDECVYRTGYSATSPMGPNVTIDPATGIVSGIAPAAGQYVIAVRCIETRSSVIMSFHDKEFLVKVSADCASVTALLNPQPAYCKSLTVNFQNDAANTGLNVDYFWDFGDPATGLNNSSTLPTPSHTFSAAGDYTVKMKASIAGNCTDSASLVVKVYPGFYPDFEITGGCKNTPVLFTDKTRTDNGSVSKWEWNFGDFNDPVNTYSGLQSPAHSYTFAMDYRVLLKVTSNKGCVDTISKFLTIRNNPVVQAFPKDTLICIADTLQIDAAGTGATAWNPNYMISNTALQRPLVSPDVTTVYKVNITDVYGCKGTDSIKINVTDRVYQGSDYDTVICEKDPVVLRLNSNALYYSWIPANGSLNNPSVKNPTATVAGSTPVIYQVTGKISDKCFAQNNIKITPVPYPAVLAPDVNVCAGESAQLQAGGGSMYTWTPSLFLNNAFIPNPQVIKPTGNVLYTLTVRDILGCPKPVQKMVRLNVIKINANAGPRDTSVVLEQPLQLNATGGSNYLWLPDNQWLNNTAINNPVALPQGNIEYIVQVSDTNGCKGLDSIRVKLFRVAPGLYVPNAFTPNGDGHNDVFRPVPLGIKSLDLFQVYNRFGQLLYSSTSIINGWNGTFKGRLQDPAAYLWVARATDYNGKKILRKGTVILIGN